MEFGSFQRSYQSQNDLSVRYWSLIFSLKNTACPISRTDFSFTDDCKLAVQLIASLMAQTVKNLPEMQETWIQSLGWDDPLEKEMATHSSILAWRTPWTEEPGGLQSMGVQRVGHN